MINNEMKSKQFILFISAKQICNEAQSIQASSSMRTRIRVRIYLEGFMSWCRFLTKDRYFLYASTSKRKNFRLHVLLNSYLWLGLTKVQVKAFTMAKSWISAFRRPLITNKTNTWSENFSGRLLVVIWERVDILMPCPIFSHLDKEFSRFVCFKTIELSLLGRNMLKCCQSLRASLAQGKIVTFANILFYKKVM